MVCDSYFQACLNYISDLSTRQQEVVIHFTTWLYASDSLKFFSFLRFFSVCCFPYRLILCQSRLVNRRVLWISWIFTHFAWLKGILSSEVFSLTVSWVSVLNQVDLHVAIRVLWNLRFESFMFVFPWSSRRGFHLVLQHVWLVFLLLKLNAFVLKRSPEFLRLGLILLLGRHKLLPLLLILDC